MDPFTQRMLERAKARREKLDTQLSNAGHDIKHRSPLKDANAIVEQAAKLVETQQTTKEKSKPQKAEITIEEPVYRTPERNKIPREVTPEKENEFLASDVKMKLQRLGKLYSDDNEELSSPIHRTEEKFSAEDDQEEGKVFKRVGSTRLDRLAALASTINNWEDDLSHPSLVKKSESKAEKVQAKMNEQVKGFDNPQPSTSGHNRWKSNNPPGKQAPSPTKPLKLDRTVLQNLESQGYTRTKSHSRLVYDYQACSQESKEGQNSQEEVKNSPGKKDVHGNVAKSSFGSPRSPLASKTPEKTPGKNAVASGTRTGNRFGGYNGSPKSTIQSSPGSVLSKASLFESKSLATKAKDPAEMTLSERMALFERNKGEALIPKGPLTLSVPTKKLQEAQKSSTNSHCDQRRNDTNNAVKHSRAFFENGLSNQELENDIVRESQAERQRELEMLRSRFNKNKEVAQAAAGSCIRPRTTSETNNGSPKNYPVCPVKPTPATDPVAPPPPPPPLPTENNEVRSPPVKRQVSVSSSSHSQCYPAISSTTKRIKMSPPPLPVQTRTGNLYPDLTGIQVSETDSTDTEYTVGTSEVETVTVETSETSETDALDTDFCSQDDSYDDKIGNSSFESSILKVVKQQQQQRQELMNNKRQMETSDDDDDDDDSTSDISVLDEMDEYLDECLANQEMNGPPPPKVNRGGESPTVASNSFNYSHATSSYRSPLIVTPSKSPKTKSQSTVDDDDHVPLMHSISFYRRQQSQTPKTPARQISRTVEVVRESSEEDEKREKILVQEKIKRLMDEVVKQQTIIGQASQALNLCTATIEFSDSREQVEGERLLLLATHRRQAALNEIQRLKVEGSLRPSVPGASEIQESGSLTISAITLPLLRDHRDNDICIHYLCLIRHLDTIIPTPVVQVEQGDSCLRFPSTIKLDDLYSNFKITIEVYSMETRAEVLPHEIKYHIAGTSASKKSGYKTPKKHKHDPRLVIPPVQSPAGPSAVRSPAFNLTGYVVFSLKEVNRQQFTLNKIPKNSNLEGHLQMHVSCQLSVSIEHRGFLTMFEDVSGLGAWHRRWCLLKGDTLSYWKYPDDERKKTPIGTLELQGVVTTNVELVSRDICARANTFLLETVRPAGPGDVESLVVVRNGSSTIIRHLLSADTKEERLDWCSKLNQTLNLIRAWGGNVSAFN